MKEPSMISAAEAGEKKQYKKVFEKYGVNIEKSNLLSLSKQEAEDFRNPWTPDRRAYGALPNFDKKQEIMEHFVSEAEYFGKHYETGQGPVWRDFSYAEGAMMFEMKFGKKLSEFAKEILENYPDLGSNEKGKEISVFGLSGAGKSSAMEAIKDLMGEKVVVIDSDTARYNLLGKMVKEVEMQGVEGDEAKAQRLEEIRSDLMHNNISGALYFLLNHVTKELKDRGYTVLQSSTMPTSGADTTIYIEHPDGINPVQLSEEEFPEVGKGLFERTQARVGDLDDFDWEKASTVLDFNEMPAVSVQVPEHVHGIFLKNIKAALETDADIKSLKNPKIDDKQQRIDNFKNQFSEFLQ